MLDYDDAYLFAADELPVDDLDGVEGVLRASPATRRGA